tara:strand:- start:194 stop:481 length:288 start_codon:yes stop_codon:yes gene_type:complete
MDGSEMPINDGPNRSVHDFHTLTHGKYRKTYFKRDPKDPNRIQVVRYFFNVFTGTVQPQFSNFHHAEPDSDWVELTPAEEGRLNRMKSLTQQQFF